MFKRPNITYDISPSVINDICNDEESPLLRIARIIPDNSKVLDIGCGNGLFSDVLNKLKKNIIIDAVEPNFYTKGIAEKKYRIFHCGYFQEIKGEIIRENYDFIILADVIEHVINPLDFLKELTAGLSNKTKIILSVPNVAFGSVRLALLNGRFEYVDSGLLERTHLRFFTINTLSDLIKKVGMNIEKKYYLLRNFWATEINISPRQVSVSNFLMLKKDILASTYQFLLVLSKDKYITEEKKFGNPRYSLSKFILRKILTILRVTT